MERTFLMAVPETPRPPRFRALGLLSGGLDSALAAALLLEQGLEVVGLHLESPVSCRSDVRAVARDLGIPLTVRPKGDEYLRMLREPRWGYGRNMNPCVDCRVFMLRRSRGYLEELGADFLFTGEVLGQRPMSQQSEKLRLIDRQAGAEGLVLRPLSAKLLPETVPERNGWVDRSRLLGISGRSRHVQLAEAARLGLARYQSPGGGCLLTDAIYSRKLRDLFDHAPPAGVAGADVELLSVGRHFRLGPALKVVLGRDAAENARLARLQGAERWLVEPDGFTGPSALVCGPLDEASLAGAVRLIARYARASEPHDHVRWHAGDGPRVRPMGSFVTAPASPAAL
jgi:tRNA-uridine 2-sulfurtransferase